MDTDRHGSFRNLLGTDGRGTTAVGGCSDLPAGLDGDRIRVNPCLSVVAPI